MNTGLGDAYDIAWKLAMTLKGAGGDDLLASYEIERRPVAVRNVQRAAEHMGVHQNYVAKALEAGSNTVFGTSKASEELRSYIKSNIDANDGENKDVGIELDYRFPGSPVIVAEPEAIEQEWNVQVYSPSTVPGSRTPHVFLEDGKTSIFSRLGRGYTVVDFSSAGALSFRIERLAKENGFLVTRLHLPFERLASKIWERDVVLVRPDHFVAWRVRPETDYSDDQLKGVLIRVFGRTSSSPVAVPRGLESRVTFKGVVDSFNQDAEKVESLAAFQS
jgi:hypothetical protein